jgi:hypothetical protein
VTESKRLYALEFDLLTGTGKISPVITPHGLDAIPDERLEEQISKSGRKKAAVQITSETLFPESIIDSLNPIIQEVFSLYSVDQDEGFWAEQQRKASMSYEDACKFLNEDGKGPVEVAKVLWGGSEIIFRAESFGNIRPETKTHAISQLAWKILEYYPEESRETWREQITKYQQKLQKPI